MILNGLVDDAAASSATPAYRESIMFCVHFFVRSGSNRPADQATGRSLHYFRLNVDGRLFAVDTACRFVTVPAFFGLRWGRVSMFARNRSIQGGVLSRGPLLALSVSFRPSTVTLDT
jgi:hypothetical protein